MSGFGKRDRIIGRTMFRSKCVDCGNIFHTCGMVGRAKGIYCQECFKKAFEEGREHGERTYNLNGEDCTKEEFEAALTPENKKFFEDIEKRDKELRG